jgi:23S rRNA pseudoU1915 N3-methylase RlmH
MSTPATSDSVSAVGYKLSDTRADILVGQGQILKNESDVGSAILRDANGNVLATQANIDRASLAGLQETNRVGERLTAQATTVAWNEMSLQDAGFAAARANTERINDAQSAFADRAAKYQSASLTDSFARLSAQSEHGFHRSSEQTASVLASLSAQHTGVTRDIAESNRHTDRGFHRSAEQTASVLASFAAQHAGLTRDLVSVGRDLSTQASVNAAATQLEAAKNTATIQLQAALNSKDAAFTAAVNSKEAAMQAAINSKEGLLENSKWFALAEKTAMVNTAQLAAKMAECCCEIKETVINTSGATQSLFQTTETARVRDALAATIAENAVLRSRREERRDDGRGSSPAPYPYPYPFPFPGGFAGPGTPGGGRGSDGSGGDRR